MKKPHILHSFAISDLVACLQAPVFLPKQENNPSLGTHAVRSHTNSLRPTRKSFVFSRAVGTTSPMSPGSRVLILARNLQVQDVQAGKTTQTFLGKGSIHHVQTLLVTLLVTSVTCS